MKIQELQSEINKIAAEVVYELSALKNAGIELSLEDLIKSIKSNTELISDLIYTSVLYPIKVAISNIDRDLYRYFYPQNNG